MSSRKLQACSEITRVTVRSRSYFRTRLDGWRLQRKAGDRRSNVYSPKK